MELDPRNVDERTTHRVLNSSVIPRPIGWVSTRTPDGVDNLAPFSYFNAVSSRPPVVMFSAGNRNRGDAFVKDSAQNAIDSGEFVLNLVTEGVLEEMDKTSTWLEPGDSEFEFVGIERSDSVRISPPRVADSVVSLECTLHRTLKVYNNTVVFGDVVHIHIDDSVLTDDEIDVRKIDAVGRAGGPYYTAMNLIDFERIPR